MWNSLSGEISRKGLENLLLQSGDLEWDIAMGRFSLEALPPVGQRARVYVWLQHTEDQMRLFGFATVSERSLFLDLLKVSGVGPKLALKALSGMRWQEFAAALEAGDAGRLSKVPGVGLKTAQKIILALQGKLVLEETSGPGASPTAELVAALAEMGFDRRQVDKVVKDLENDASVAGLAEQERERRLFQLALVRLSTGS
jgi:Holliday junction DNA helicase RuvA